MCNCKQATRLVSERLDRRLALLERLRLKLHLTVCGRCQEYADQLQLIDTMCEQVNEEEHFAG